MVAESRDGVDGHAHDDLSISASDGYQIGAKFYRTSGDVAPSLVALVNAGAGIALGFYERFARFLSADGIPTLLYDYRGIGLSRPPSLKGFTTSVFEWGSKDCAAALFWLAAHYPRAKRVVFGHSVGGFVTGFVTNGQLIDQMILIGAHTGYWRDYAPLARPGMYALWHVLMPAVTRAVGYFPGRRLRLLEDLPAGVAREWANRRRPEFWWNLRTVDGAPDTERIDRARMGFRVIRAKTLAVRFSDDPFGTETATKRILGLYENCTATQLVFRPREVGERKIGHFGFFRSKFSRTLWPRVVDWLTS